VICCNFTRSDFANIRACSMPFDLAFVCAQGVVLQSQQDGCLLSILEKSAKGDSDHGVSHKNFDIYCSHTVESFAKQKGMRIYDVTLSGLNASWAPYFIFGLSLERIWRTTTWASVFITRFWTGALGNGEELTLLPFFVPKPVFGKVGKSVRWAFVRHRMSASVRCFGSRRSPTPILHIRKTYVVGSGLS